MYLKKYDTPGRKKIVLSSRYFRNAHTERDTDTYIAQTQTRIHTQKNRQGRRIYCLIRASLFHKSEQRL